MIVFVDRFNTILPLQGKGHMYCSYVEENTKFSGRRTISDRKIPHEP